MILFSLFAYLFSLSLHLPGLLNNYSLFYKELLASFPGRSHLQYLIAYSMQIRRGKVWEIWSRVVTSGRHTGGGAHRGISKPFLVLLVQGLEARALARQCQYHPSFTAPGTVRHETAIAAVGHRPPCVYLT